MNKNLLSLVTVFFVFTVGTVSAQNSKFTYQKKPFSIKKIGTFHPQDVKSDFDPILSKTKEAPVPGGESYKSFLIEQKKKAKQLYAAQKNSQNVIQSTPSSTAPSVEVVNNYGLFNAFIPALDTALPIQGGNPLDNTMAISNNGMLMVSVNSLVYAYDLNADTVIYKPSQFSHTISFQKFAEPLAFDLDDAPFDPKLLFDPVHDRFIMTFLAGRTPSDSRIVVGFSTSSHPGDPWNMYEITGNPRGLNEWTDYPAIAVTENDLFYTVNLIERGVSWQAGFRGSIIWQVPLEEAYSGATNLPTTLWDDIKYEGVYTRNLCPVEGAMGPMGPNMYFLSNRNFDVTNDSIFVIEVTDSYASNNAELNVTLGITPTAYGMPPNGKQEDTDLSDESTGLQTNDSRMLGAFLHNNQIQYVANTMNFSNGLASVYHGIIKNVNTDQPSFEGVVISDPVKDFGYPNIAFTGNSAEETEAIIAFNHTSVEGHPGISCIYYSDCNGYSEVTVLKEGLDYVEQINGPYERWGDYFGIQRVFNEPGKVWTSGFYGSGYNNKSSIWMSELKAPAYDVPTVTIDTEPYEYGNNCITQLYLNGNGGAAPYQFIWNATPLEDSTVTINLCNEDYSLQMIDAYNCSVTKEGSFEVVIPSNKVFPNPFGDKFSVSFELGSKSEVTFTLIDMRGRVVKEWKQANVDAGQNQFSFSTSELESGLYSLIISVGTEDIVTEKLLKIE